MPLSTLAADLTRIADGYSGTCTYALTDLTSGEHLGRDEDEVMPAASLIKVPVLVALYQAVHEGRLALEDRTAYREEHKSPGSGVLMRLTPGVEMTVRDAATLMIIISDNAATNMCVELAGGLDAINAVMRKLGLERTELFVRWGERREGFDYRDGRKTWVSTAGEMTRLPSLIARHEAVSADASEEMLRILRRQDYRNELSGRLPWNELNALPDHRRNWVAEKGGAYLNGVRCSGAVFHGARGQFAMSVFCEGGMAGGGTGRQAEGNLLIGELGYAAWQALAAGDSLLAGR